MKNIAALKRITTAKPIAKVAAKTMTDQLQETVIDEDETRTGKKTIQKSQEKIIAVETTTTTTIANKTAVTTTINQPWTTTGSTSGTSIMVEKRFNKEKEQTSCSFYIEGLFFWK